MQLNPQFAADLVTLTGEIVNGKLHFLCSKSCRYSKSSEVLHTFIKLVSELFLLFGLPLCYFSLSFQTQENLYFTILKENGRLLKFFQKKLSLFSPCISNVTYCASSRLDMFQKRALLKNFVTVTEKHLYLTFFFKKIEGRLTYLLSKEMYSKTISVQSQITAHRESVK